MKFSKDDLRLLQLVLEKAKALESEFSRKDAGLFEKQLSELQALLKTFEFSEDPKLSRQAVLADHLHPEMTLRHFLNFMIPIERLLDRSLSDEDILITTEDQPELIDQPKRPLIFVLDNLRSAFNVGSLYRTAETLGCEGMYLCGYTPGPESKGVQKTAMGTEHLTQTRRFERIDEALAHLQASSFARIALETSPQAIPLYDGVLNERTAFVVGNERFGLDYHTLKLCDEVRSIPLSGTKNSLNVATALAVAGFEWSRQRRGR